MEAVYLVTPDTISFTITMDAVAKGGGGWQKVEGLLKEMTQRGLQPDLATYNTLMDAYGTCISYCCTRTLHHLATYNTRMDA
jgi:hypothetical protein